MRHDELSKAIKRFINTSGVAPLRDQTWYIASLSDCVRAWVRKNGSQRLRDAYLACSRHEDRNLTRIGKRSKSNFTIIKSAVAPRGGGARSIEITSHIIKTFRVQAIAAFRDVASEIFRWTCVNRESRIKNSFASFRVSYILHDTFNAIYFFILHDIFNHIV